MWIIFGLIVAAVFLISYLINYFFRRQLSFWASKGVHVFRDDITVFKILMGKAPLEYDLPHYQELVKLGLPYGGRSEVGSRVLVVRDMELIKSILVKDFDYFMDRRHFAKEDPIFSNSVFFMEGQRWKNIRAALTPTFSSGKLRRMFEQFDLSGQKLEEFVHKQYPKASSIGFDVNLDDILRRYTVDVIGSVAFGMDTKALKEKDSDFLKYASKASNFNLLRMFIMTSVPKIAKLLKMSFIDAESSNFFQRIIIAAIKHRQSSGEHRNDFLQLLLEARDASNKQRNDPNSTEDNLVDFSDAVLISQAFIFFFAGFDSTATTLRNMMYLLTAHPEVQDRLREEINEKVRLSNGEVTYDSVSAMEYLDMVVSETLRYRTGGMGTRLERKCMNDYKIPGTDVIIPKDTLVVIPFVGIHQDEEFYPNPDEFNPENFSAEQKAAKNPFRYLSFGQGPRNCIAKRFALMEVKAAAVHILMKFKIQPSDKFPLPLKWEAVMGGQSSLKDSIARFIPISE